MADNTPNPSLDDAALDEYLKDPRFSQTFELAPDESQGRTEALRITYADYGYRNEADSDSENVFLFFGPLLGSRMIHVCLDDLAKQHRVRIINPDRPGFGQTTDASPETRISFWRNAVLALLKHLNIQHASIGTQSGGTVYALDFLLHHPQILHPTKGYVALGAPWIHPSRSGCWAMSVTQSIPRVLMEQTDKFASLITTVSAPVVSTSFGLVDVVRGLLPGAKVASEQPADPHVLLKEALQPKMLKFIYDSSVHGLSQDAILLMKRAGETPGWGDWGDYDALIPRLADKLRDRGQRVVVEVFLGETDYMIGDAGSKGPEWFDRCWEEESDKEGSPIEFSSKVVDGADHNTTWDAKWGIPQHVFQTIGVVVES